MASAIKVETVSLHREQLLNTIDKAYRCIIALPDKMSLEKEAA
jgi:hypothetical protein